MPLPDPKPGLVIGYSYLWQDQARTGREEGAKDRPCVIVLAAQRQLGGLVVHVTPITHTRPALQADGVELPPGTKARLGLDDQTSWIVTTELNCFTWPGPDLRPISRDKPDTFVFGEIPLGILQQVITQIRIRGRIVAVGRDA